jgi:hypothetical protein
VLFHQLILDPHHRIEGICSRPEIFVLRINGADNLPDDVRLPRIPIAVQNTAVFLRPITRVMGRFILHDVIVPIDHTTNRHRINLARIVGTRKIDAPHVGRKEFGFWGNDSLAGDALSLDILFVQQWTVCENGGQGVIGDFVGSGLIPGDITVNLEGAIDDARRVLRNGPRTALLPLTQPSTQLLMRHPQQGGKLTLRACAGQGKG